MLTPLQNVRFDTAPNLNGVDLNGKRFKGDQQPTSAQQVNTNQTA